MNNVWSMVVSSVYLEEIDKGNRRKEACNGNMQMFLQRFGNRVIFTDGKREIVRYAKNFQYYASVDLLQKDYDVGEFYRGFLWNNTNCKNGITVFFITKDAP